MIQAVTSTNGSPALLAMFPRGKAGKATNVKLSLWEKFRRWRFKKHYEVLRVRLRAYMPDRISDEEIELLLPHVVDMYRELHPNE